MPSITTWTRLEPVTASDDLASGVSARVHDPLWFLARQWQVAEFQGEDGGSPVVARWRGIVSPLSRYHLGPLEPDVPIIAPQLEEDAGLPLEAFVERQPVRLVASDSPPADGLRLAVDTGRHFLRMLAVQGTSRDYTAGFVRTFGLLPLADDSGLDAATRTYLRFMTGKVVDGRRLRAALARSAMPVLDGETIASGDRAEVRVACSDWLVWADGLFSAPAEPASDAATQAWQPDRMEYAFSVAARIGPAGQDEFTLTADQYADGTLDWYSFDRNVEVSVGTTELELGEVETRTVVPAPVTLPGMPAHRFWEFEDAVIDLGALRPGATDLVSLLMVETITGFGNDWFVVPIDLPVGSLSRSRSLVVTDTFGFSQLVRPSGHPDLGGPPTGRHAWCMFQLADQPTGTSSEGADEPNAFFLPATVALPQEGPVLEEVMLLRDEMANLAWAVERRLESPLERGLDVSAYDLAPPAAPAAANPEVPEYQLATSVPDHWIPLLPVAFGNAGQIRLARAALLDVNGGRRVVHSQAKVLGTDPLAPLLIPEEEVPREGVIVRRAYQGARWYGGELIVWSAYRKSVGRGEGSSGLRFDSLRD